MDRQASLATTWEGYSPVGLSHPTSSSYCAPQLARGRRQVCSHCSRQLWTPAGAPAKSRQCARCPNIPDANPWSLQRKIDRSFWSSTCRSVKSRSQAIRCGLCSGTLPPSRRVTLLFWAVSIAQCPDPTCLCLVVCCAPGLRNTTRRPVSPRTGRVWPPALQPTAPEERRPGPP